jgi:hypothetical protein
MTLLLLSKIMPPKELVNRLKEHSGLPGVTPELGTSSFFDRVQAIQKGEPETGLEEAVVDVIECLQRLNYYNRGATETPGEILNSGVVYAISGRTLFATEVSLTRSQKGEISINLLNACWKIACAWDAVLAGDIEDIYEHLEWEATARNFDVLRRL